MSNKMNIGETIKSIRLRAGMTQAEFAKAIGWNQGFLSECEGGKKAPNIIKVEAIVKFAKSKKIKIKLEDIFQTTKE